MEGKDGGGMPRRRPATWSLWWSLSTMTTVGYGDHVPVTTVGRFIAAGVMVIGVAVIGAVAAILALAMAIRVAIEEERAFDAEAKIFEQRIEVRLAGIEARLAGLDARLAARLPAAVNESMSGDATSSSAT